MIKQPLAPWTPTELEDRSTFTLIQTEDLPSLGDLFRLSTLLFQYNVF